MEHTTKPNSLKVNFLLNTFLQLINLIAPFVTAPYISRVLGVEQVGIFSYTYSINYYLVLIAGLGTATYGTVEIAKVRDDNVQRSMVFWGIEIITIFSSLICILFWILLSTLYTRYSDVLFPMTLYLFVVMFDISWFYLGMECVQYSVIINSFFKIIGIILIFIHVKSSADLVKYIYILSGTMVLGNLSMWFFLSRFIAKVNFKKINFLVHIKGTMLYFIPTIATSVYAVLDKMLIGLITDSTIQNAFYEQSSKIVGLAKTVSLTSLSTLFGSRMAYLYAHNQFIEIEKKRDFALEYVLAISIGVSFGLMGISDNFIPFFFGKEYTPASKFLVLMAPLIPIMGISNMIGNMYYNPSGRRKKSTYLLLIGCGANILLNIFLIPYFFGIGAVIASLLAEFLISSMYVYFSNSFVTFKMVYTIAWRKVLAASVMFFFLSILDSIFASGFKLLIFQCVGGFVIYISFLYMLRDKFLKYIIDDIFRKKISEVQ